MEEEMMKKIMGFSSFGNPKLVVEESSPSPSSSRRRKDPEEAGIDEDRRRHRRRRSRSRSSSRSRSRSREKKKSDRDRSRDRSKEKKPRRRRRSSRSPKARSSRRNENSSSTARPKSKIEDVKNQRFSENVSNNEVQKEAKVVIPDEKEVFGQQIVMDIIEDILTRVFRKTRDIFHEEMAKYFRKTISQICHLKYEEAKFVANQMVDVVEIAFPDVIRNLQEPYEMAKLKQNYVGGDPYLMEFRRELHYQMRTSNAKKTNFRFSEVVDLTMNFLGQI